MKIKIEKAAKVGEAITKIVASAGALGQELHVIMVQCALHVREHGDTSLASRLVNELTNSAGAAINVQGIRAWFGRACPMVIDNATKNWKLIDKTSETYSKYIDRMNLMTAKTKGDISTAQPDESSGPGGRVFFVDWAADNTYWEDGDTRAAQRQNVRVMGLDGVVGLAFAIRGQVESMKNKGAFLPSAAEAADEFIKKIEALAEDFKKAHAVDIVGESRALSELKASLQKGEQPTSITEPTEPTPEVGGNVTDGIETPADETVEQPVDETIEPPAEAVNG